jgi:molybdopterin-guanine dinucleotide biosynthesis protein A
VDKPLNSQGITAVILAGGRASRMGGADKGLQNFNGAPMALRALMRIAPQVDGCLINANRNLSLYESFGVPVWPDGNADFAGPLSGFVVGLQRTTTPYLLTIPCDTPFFPKDIAKRMLQSLEASNADIAMAAQAGHTQPVFCLIKQHMLESLLAFMQTGGRKIDRWTDAQKTIFVHFDEPTDDKRAFANANTAEELEALEQLA